MWNYTPKLLNGVSKIAVFSLFIAISTPLLASETQCPQRIISLTLASDEILLDIISDTDRILALTYLASDYKVSNVSEKSKNIKGIRANIEEVLVLDPDLVIVADYTTDKFKEQIKNLGIEILNLKSITSVQALKENIRLIGESICEEKNSEILLSDINQKVKTLNDKIPKDGQLPRIIYYTPSGFTAGNNTTVNEIIKLSGGENIATRAGIENYKKVSLEFILSKNPDVIILSSYNPDAPSFNEKFIANPALRHTEAYKKNRIVILNGKFLVSASHYFINAVTELIEVLNSNYWYVDVENEI